MEAQETVKTKSTFREYAEAIGMALLLALFIRTFIVQAFKIPSGSMIPTLQIGDHILVNKLAYGIRVPLWGHYLVDFGKVQRGDVIVFIFPEDRSKDFIKRVVGVAGDTVEVRGKKIYINGQQVEDSHAHFEGDDPQNILPASRDDYGPTKVPENHLFVMGDNRDNSADSRVPVRAGGVGLLPVEDLVGRVDAIVGSWDLAVKSRPIQDWPSGLRLSRFFTSVH